MATIQEATEQINALSAQMDKVIGEIQVLIDAAGTLPGTTPEFDAALATLSARIQAADDKNPDAPTV